MDLQKASMWKRISAGLFDGILLAMLAVGFFWLLSLALGYDRHEQAWTDACARYEQQYDVIFEISRETYEAMTEAEQQNYNAAYEALCADEEAMYAYNMTANLTLITVTGGILLAMLLLEFTVPLLFKNGQTLGKKIFGVGLMRFDGVKLSPVQLFTRTVLGKFALETMIPVYICILFIFGAMGIGGTLLLGALGLAQLILLIVTRENALIHDKRSGTVAVDFASQMIFDTPEALLEYKKRISAEQAKKQTY